MWLKIGISLLFAVAGAVGGYYLAHTSKRVTPTLLFNETVVLAYGAWATFWGWGRVWRIWRRMLNGIGCAVNVFLVPLALYLFIAIPFLLAACYGMFGGSILELVLVLISASRLRKRLQRAGPQSRSSQQLVGQQNQSWQLPLSQQDWSTQQNQNWPQAFTPQHWGPQETGQQHWGGQQPPAQPR